MKNNISEITEEILISWLKKNKEPKFRCKQILDWIYKKQIVNPDEMLNLSIVLRDKLKEDFEYQSSKVIETQISKDGTIKILIELFDKETIEAVIIKTSKRVTFCLSTQVGCPVKCYFCASGENGLVRNLSAGEIIEQFYLACEVAETRPTNIVFMGIGEGLLNFDNLTKSLDLLCNEKYIDFASRKITVSTSGISEGIRKLADLKGQWNLAISLHAPDEETRRKLIPDHLREDLDDILDACIYYREKANRMVTFEYTLIKDVNDSEYHAEELAELAWENRAKVNLIPYNMTFNDFERPRRKTIDAFASILESKKIQVSVRLERGADLAAACGQLRKKVKDSD